MTTPGALRLQRLLRAMVQRRRPGGGRRDDLARPGRRARRRRRLRRGDPDQPDPRAPRVPRHVRGLPRGQAQPVRAPRRAASGEARRAPAGRGRQPRRPERRSVRRGDTLRRRAPRDLRAGAPAPTSARPRSRRDRGGLRIGLDAPGGPSALALPLAGRFNVHNALAASPWGSAGASTRRPSGPVSKPSRRARPDGADRPRPAVRGRRRLRPQPGGTGDRPRPPAPDAPTRPAAG